MRRLSLSQEPTIPIELRNEEEEKEVFDNHALLKEKMEVSGILKKALKISNQNTNFTIFIFLTSLPLLITMVFNELIFQRTLVEASKMLFRYFYYNWPVPTYIQGWLLRYFGFKLIQLGFLYLFPLHLLELFTMFVTVDLTSKLYSGETPLTLREMGQRPIKEARFKAPFITSIHVLYLSTSTILGLTLLVTLYYFISRNIFYGYFFVVAFAAVFAAVLGKYLEVCALCNMRMVISVLERINWAEAIALSDYFRRDSKRHGLFFYACFLCLGIWFTVTMPCFWLLQECGTGGRAGELALDGEMWGNMIKQAAIMIYFYDSKEQTLEVGGEEVVDAEAMVRDRNSSQEMIDEKTKPEALKAHRL